MATRRAPAPSPFRYDPARGQYQDARSGRFVSQRQVAGAVDSFLERQGADMRRLTAELKRGGLSLDQWALDMRSAIKDSHLGAAAAAKGGWAQMRPSDFGRVGRTLRDQYAYLDAWVGELANGKAPSEGRAVLYAKAAVQTFEAARLADDIARGLDEERNLRSARDSCTDSVSRQGCIEQTRRSWVPIGTLVPKGQRTCLGHCQCYIERRRSSRAKRAAAAR